MTRTLAQYVAAQLRAEMARQQIPAYRLAQLMGKDETWVGRRTRNKAGITLDDLEAFARALGVPVHTFMPTPERVA